MADGELTPRLDDETARRLQKAAAPQIALSRTLPRG